MAELKRVEGTITLHGLGFIVVQLTDRTRLHVWHPDLPKRKCFESTRVHNHRFSFESQVLVGALRNVVWARSEQLEFAPQHTFVKYSHDGERLAVGGRGWKPVGEVVMEVTRSQAWEAEEKYNMPAYEYHHTEVASRDGRAATLMTKTWEGITPASSLGRPGVEPDVGFDRYQLSPGELWGYVVDVLGRYSSEGKPMPRLGENAV